MLKMLFPWLKQEVADVKNLLKNASRQEHALAQFNLYRQQEDPKQAIYWISRATNQNPQYLYLQAMHHNKMQARELAKSVEDIREVIDLGNDYNGDTAPWQQQLNSGTTGGRVTIQEL